MSDIVIRAEGLSKKFCKTIKHTMLYGGIDITKSFLGLMPSAGNLREGEFWALEDINFELKRGECLGLIGPNGAGKSTLLKILNGIMAPDRGCVEIKGRSGALIEVGAGFHPMLTGRENIYVNGSILGLSRAEIDAKFDEIVDFSGVEDFIDSPVKHYSSGMFVRLGFAIAAQTEPDILLIDEILAVGDAGFRAKCYNFVSRINQNAAVVFVSHTMQSVTRICSKVMVIDSGRKAFEGETSRGIKKYFSMFPSQHSIKTGSGRADIISLKIKDLDGKLLTRVEYNHPVVFEIKCSVVKEIKHPVIFLGFHDREMRCVAEISSRNNNVLINNAGNQMTARIQVENFNLNPDDYTISCCIYCERMQEHCAWHYSAWDLKVTGDFYGMNPVQFFAQWQVE